MAAGAAARDERGEMSIVHVVEKCPSSECIEGEGPRGRRAFGPVIQLPDMSLVEDVRKAVRELGCQGRLRFGVWRS